MSKKKKVTTDPLTVGETILNEYREMIIYLGQLEFNIINTSETLNKMQMEKRKAIDKLRELEGQLDIDSDPGQSL